MQRKQKEALMDKALSLAIDCIKDGDVPVGCVVVLNGKIVGQGRNTRQRGNCATAHAEINAINDACRTLGTMRLDGCDIFVTLEPCPMCAGAIALSRIKKIYIGAMDFVSGACGSKINVFDFHPSPPPKIEFGILKNECGTVLSSFFEALRNDQTE